jgi:hypothetical protein
MTAHGGAVRFIGSPVQITILSIKRHIGTTNSDKETIDVGLGGIFYRLVKSSPSKPLMELLFDFLSTLEFHWP